MESGDRGRVPDRLKAALTLVLLVPLSAELTFSAVGMPVMWGATPFLIPMYGFGVLVIRELVARAGGGWPSLLLMGLVYELAEDGLGLQALTSPTLYNAADWGPRLLGFNLTYWQSQIGYHLVFSVLIPVLITDLLFPRHRGRPYLRRGGLIGAGITAAVGIALLKIVFTRSTDPGYWAPWPVLGCLLAGMIILSVIALRVLPGRSPALLRLPIAGPPPPMISGALAAAGTLLFLALLMPAGHPPTGPAIGTGALVWIPMGCAALVGIAALLAIGHWADASRLTDRHRIWLAGGALVGHTLFAAGSTVLVPTDALSVTLASTTGPVIIALTILLLNRLSRRVATRTAAVPATSTAVPTPTTPSSSGRS